MKLKLFTPLLLFLTVFLGGINASAETTIPLTYDMWHKWDGFDANAGYASDDGTLGATHYWQNNVNTDKNEEFKLFGFSYTEDGEFYADLSNYLGITGVATPGTKLLMRFNRTGTSGQFLEQTAVANADGKFEYLFSELKDGSEPVKFVHLNFIKVSLPEGVTSVKVESINCILKPDPYELNASWWHEWDGYEKGANITNLTPNLANNIGKAVAGNTEILGSGGVEGRYYADLTEYKGIEAKGTPGKGLRFLFNRPSLEGGSAGITERNPTFDNNGNFTFMFSKIDDGYPYVHLNAIKSGHGQDDCVITLLKVIPKNALTIDMWHSWEGMNEDTKEWGPNCTIIDNHNSWELTSQLGVEGTDHLVMGNYAGGFFADLSKYGGLQGKGTPNTTVRFYFNRTDNSGNSGTGIDKYVGIASDGTFKLNFSDLGENLEYIHLNFVKYSGTGAIEYIHLIDPLAGAKEALKNAIENAKLQDGEGMTKESFAALLSAIAAGEVELENENATQESLTEATNNIKTAIEGLTPDPLIAAKENLTELLNAAKLYDSFAKTEASWNALQTEISSAETALDAPDASESSLAAASKSLQDAIEGLTLEEGYEFLTAEMFKHYASVDEPGDGEAAGCAYKLFEETDNPYGIGNSAYLDWADVSNYDKFIVTFIGNDKPRVWINRLKEDGQDGSSKEDSKMLDMQAGNNKWSTAKYTEFDSDNNIFTVDLKSIVKDYGFARVHGIKYSWGGKGIVTGMYLYISNDELELPLENLSKEIEKAEQCDRYLKTEESLQKLDDAIAEGKTKLEEKKPTVESVEAATQKISDAIAGLKFIDGYSNLSDVKFKEYDSVENPGEGKDATCSHIIGTAAQTPYGNDGVSHVQWADITDYDQLIVTFSGEDKPRVMMNRMGDNLPDADKREDSKMLEMQPEKNKWSTTTYTTYDADQKIFTVKLKDIVDDFGFARLNAIKFNSGVTTGVVTGMYLYKEATNEFTLSFNVDDPSHVIVKVDDATQTLKAGDNDVKVDNRAKLSIAAADKFKISSLTANDVVVELKDEPYSKVIVKNISYKIVTEDANPLAPQIKELNALIEKAKLRDDFLKTKTSWDALQAAITSAEAEVAKADATKESLEKATSDLNNAVKGLALVDDYSYLTPEMYKKYASLDQPGEGEATDCPYVLFEASDNAYGNSANSELEWADLSNYDSLIITTYGNDTKPLISLNRIEANGQQADTKEASKMIEINPYVNDYKWSTEKYQTIEDKSIEDNKAYAYIVDLKQIAKDFGFARLHSIKKSGWNTLNPSVSGMYLYKNPVVEVTSVTLDVEKIEDLMEGESVKLTATVAPDNATDKTVTWSSSDAKVATVDQEGNVTAVAPGKVTITAAAGEVSAKCEITVTAKPIDVKGIVLNESEVTLVKGAEFDLTYTISPDNATDKTVTWTTSNDKVATVDQNGKVTAIDGGQATITAASKSNPEVKATCTITVTVPVAGLAILNEDDQPLDSTHSLAMFTGDGYTLTEVVSPENATEQKVTWTSSNEAVAKIVDIEEEPHQVHIDAIAAGEATITATLAGFSTSFKVTVADPVIAVTGIKLDKAVAEMKTGESLQLTATIEPEDASSKEVTWRSSDNTTATVSTKGVVKALKAGKVTITATANKLTATCEITITDIEVTEIKLDKTEATLIKGETLSLSATVNPENATNPALTWNSSNEKVATVDAEGNVTTVDGGEAVITVTSVANPAIKASCTVKVIVPVEGLVILNEDEQPLDSTHSLAMHTGDEYTLTEVVSPANATEQKVVWTSSNEAVAKIVDIVEEPRQVHIDAIAVGEATITASIAGFTTSFKVTVSAPVVAVTGIKLDKAAAEMKTGETLQLNATIEPEDATSKEVKWTSSDNTIATVSTKGVVTALKAGKVTITATANKLTATCEITITDPYIEVVEITLDKTEATIKIGDDLQLTATVTPGNATDATVTWTTSDDFVATVNSDGKVSAVGEGIVTITAQSGDKTAECVITVTKETSAVELIGFDPEAPVKVFDLNGIFVGDTMEGLQQGTYIVRQGNAAKKVRIR